MEAIVLVGKGIKLLAKWDGLVLQLKLLWTLLSMTNITEYFMPKSSWFMKSSWNHPRYCYTNITPVSAWSHPEAILKAEVTLHIILYYPQCYIWKSSWSHPKLLLDITHNYDIISNVTYYYQCYLLFNDYHCNLPILCNITQYYSISPILLILPNITNISTTAGWVVCSWILLSIFNIALCYQ